MTLEEANQKAAQLEVMFMETSAKAGHNVKSLFKKIAMELVGMEKESEVAETQNTSAFRPRPSLPRLAVLTGRRNRRDRATSERGARCGLVQLLICPTHILYRTVLHTGLLFGYVALCKYCALISIPSLLASEPTRSRQSGGRKAVTPCVQAQLSIRFSILVQ